ncbi:hypothetical protein MCOR27_007143 [Pyricularia oryzae]|nr:hypothetical protein MCOR27_007143 [Pyricularia oryzae]KAI6406336.1 hypothetical protein MCOR20_006224 [Pyricularia oryzae]KAI6414929.1 hypothetical protein MCOR21_011542 [Pyricularia oryzae]KAI6512293.1 hypothetical protein MCOR13_000100 [Pyricularia oryzae]KAI6546847.1 hypothetical protein MCOR03_011539 [Pyricularia oryzae]
MFSNSTLRALRSPLVTSFRTTTVFGRAQPFRKIRYSSSSSKPSLSGNFYKTFGRPILKVVLSAMFVYQVAYYGWVKMETDEITRDREEQPIQLRSPSWRTRSAHCFKRLSSHPRISPAPQRRVKGLIVDEIYSFVVDCV